MLYNDATVTEKHSKHLLKKETADCRGLVLHKLVTLWALQQWCISAATHQPYVFCYISSLLADGEALFKLGSLYSRSVLALFSAAHMALGAGQHFHAALGSEASVQLNPIQYKEPTKTGFKGSISDNWFISYFLDKGV